MAKNIFKDDPRIKKIDFKPGQTIIKENFTDTKLYILRKGKVEIIKQGIHITFIEERGTFIGEISSIVGSPRNATVKAASDVSMNVIENLSDFLKDNPEVALNLAKVLGGRIMDMNAKFVALKKNIDELEKIVMQEVEKETQEIADVQSSLQEIEKTFF